MRGQAFEHAPRRGSISRPDGRKGLGDGGFHGAASNRIDTTASGRQPQHGTASIVRMVLTHEQSLAHKSLEYAGECAGMNVQDGGEVTGRQAGTETGDAQHQPLRARHPELTGHPFRHPLQSMDNRPQQLHELEHIRQIERCVLIVASVWRCGHYFEFKTSDDTSGASRRSDR